MKPNAVNAAVAVATVVTSATESAAFLLPEHNVLTSRSCSQRATARCTVRHVLCRGSRFSRRRVLASTVPLTLGSGEEQPAESEVAQLRSFQQTAEHNPEALQKPEVKAAINDVKQQDGRVSQIEITPDDEDEKPFSITPPLDWRKFRAQLIAGGARRFEEQLNRNQNPTLAGVPTWAHELSEPEKGCLMVANPTQFQSEQTYFQQSVVVIAEHGPDGSAGFILNRPTTFKIGQVTEGLGEFEDCPLYLGGDVGEGSVQIMHPYGPDKLPGAMEIISGIYIGGNIADAQELVRRGEAKDGDFRFMLQVCGWGPGQLKQEMQAGVWYCAATSQEVVLKQCIQLPVPLWREVMQLMGGKYSLISREVYGQL